MKRNTRIVLVYPPISDSKSPYLSLPSLTAFLRNNGYKVIQRDLNIEAYNALLTKERLQAFYNKAYKTFKDLEGRVRFSPGERSLYARMAEVLVAAPNVIENIEKAKEILKDKKYFYDFSRYKWAAEIFQDALKLILGKGYHYIDRFKARSIAGLIEASSDGSINPFFELIKEEIVPSILRDPPDILGISVTYQSQMIPAFTLARLIKEKAKEIHICMGGCMVTILAESLSRNKGLFSFMDSFIINEGEHALLELVKRIENNKSIKGVPNLVTYNNIGKNIFIEDIDSLPTPDFDGLPLRLYFSPELALPILASRGCYWGECVFCNVQYGSSGIYHRTRGASRVMDDMRSLKKRYKTKYFIFSDNTLSPGLLRRLSSLIINKKIDLCWQGGARLEKDLNLALCEFIAKAGCRNLTFGFESGSPRVLRLMRKGTNLRTAKSVLENCKKAGINTDLQFFIGFPTETRSEAMQTLIFIAKNRKIIKSVSFAGSFYLLKGIKVFSCGKEYGINKIYKKNRFNNLELRYNYETGGGMDNWELGQMRGLFHGKIKELFPDSLMHPCPNFNAHRLLYSSYYYGKDDAE